MHGDTPEDLLARIWRDLTEAVQVPGHPLRLGVLATSAPAARLVVLRAVDAEAGTLTAFTDVRSEKVQQIRENARVEWLFWRTEGEQIRLRGEVRIETEGPAVEAAWARLSAPARREYAGLAVPGAGVEAPGGPQVSEAEARAHFARLVCSVEAIDHLRLGLAGDHRRLRFTRAEGWRGTWRAP